jgi:hypothetical protein
MRPRALVLLVLTFLGTSLLATSTAAAAGGPPDVRSEVKKIIRDCARDDDLDRRYSLQALRLALRYLPDDLRDYTGCERAIRRAIRRAKDHDHGGHHHGGHHQHGHRQKAARAT